MRPADRLFQIVLQLGRGRVLTAADLAARLEVSERTIYRDIANLMGSGVPIDGEAGVGYRLHRGYQVPPMMFDSDEIQALIFGAQVAKRWGDRDLAEAAERILDKIDSELIRNPKRFPALSGPFSGMRKFRVGDYRVIFVVLDKDVLILRIQDRKDVYRKR